MKSERLRSHSFALFLFLIFAKIFVFAGPGRTTYQAKIIKPDGYPLEASNVNFRFTILDPAENCILYTETYSAVNMSATGGLVSFALGSGVKTYPVSATTFEQVFSNITPSLSCDTGGPANYSPATDDVRKIVMQFHDGSGWQTLPAMSINAVPYAMYATEAQRLGGVSATAFVQDSEIPTCAGGQALFYNGSAFSCVSAGGSGVTSSTVIAALGYTPADGASLTAINSSIATVSSTVGSVNTSVNAVSATVSSVAANLSAVSGSVFSVSATVSSLQSTVTSLSSSVAASFAAIISSQWTTSGTTISYSAGAVGIGTAAPDKKLHVKGVSYSMVVFEDDTEPYVVMRKTNAAVGSKNLGFSYDGNNLYLNRMSDAYNWTSTLLTVTSSGHVGIGTTTPVAKLDVAGGIRISMDSSACAVALAGTLRYNSGVVEFCDGTTWSAFGISGAGILSINGLASGSQTFVIAQSGLLPNILSSGSVHTFNFPNAASASVTAGLLSNADYQIFTNKLNSSSAAVIAALGYTPANDLASGTYLQKTNNLSDLASASAARTNLGLGSLATANSIDLSSAQASGTLAAARLPAFSGDISSPLGSAVLSLVTVGSGVASGTQYTKVTVDGKGRVVSGAQLLSSDVTTALGYTPANSTSATQWTTSGSTIFYNTGNVGLGTSSPAQKLSVVGIIETTTGGIKFPDGSIQTSAATGIASGAIGSAVAWVAFSSTGAILSSFNVASVTKNSTGNFTVNFTNNLSDSNYAVMIGGVNTGNGDGAWGSVDKFNTATPKTTSSVRISTFIYNGAAQDWPETYVAIYQGNGTAPLSQGWTEAGANIYRLTGNMGIGTSSPNSELDVSGTIRATQICDRNGNNCQTISSGWSGMSGSGTTILSGWPDAIRCKSSGGIDYILYLAGDYDSSLKKYYATARASTGDQNWMIYNTDGTYYSHLSMGAGFDCVTSAMSITQLYNANQAYKFVGGGGGGTGTVSQVTAVAPLLVSGTVSPQISIATSGSVSGQTLRFDGASWQRTKLFYTDLLNSTAASPWPVSSCGAGQAITWSSATDSFSCAMIQITSAQLPQTNLASTASGGVTGVLPVANGGTGATSFTTNSVLLGNGTGAINALAAGASGSVLVSQGSGSPQWQTLDQLTSGANNTMVSGWPDVIRCSSSIVGTEMTLIMSEHARSDGYTIYRSPEMGGTYTYVYFNSTTGAYVGALNLGTTNCAGLSISQVVANGKSFNFAKGPVGQWLQNGSNAYYNIGNVGIGTASPITRLDVSGGVRIGTEITACAATLAGTLRYNASNIEYCNGSSWQAFGISSSGLTLLNGSASQTQTFANGTAGTQPSYTTANGVHTLNIPLASAGSVTAGLISNADYTTFINKITSSAASIAQVLGYTPASATSLSNYLVKANNLSDLASNVTARTNLGLGTLAVGNSIDLGSASATGTLAVARLPSFSGDVVSFSGSSTMIVAGLRGINLSTVAPVSGQALVYDGVNWVPSTVGSASGSQNVVSIEYTTVASTTSTTWVDVPGFSVTFSPTTISSKVLVFANVVAGMNGATSGFYRILRDGTPIAVPSTVAGYTSHSSANVYGGSADGNNNEESTVIYMDTPGTLSPVTYKIQMMAPQGSIMYVNALGSDISGQVYSSRTRSSLTIAEISQSTIASSGSGTANYIPVWSSTTALGNSPIAVSGGNVGIGTTTPTTKLEISNGATFSPASNTSGALRLTGNYGGGLIFKDTAYAGMWTSDAGQTLNFSSSGTASGFGSSYGQMVLKNGNVGVGTSAPTEKLEVSGSLKVTGEITGTKSWGFKKGPLAYIADYVNSWNAGYHVGSSIDCTSSANGCTILKAGTYEVRCVQRANSTTSAYVGIALNGDRTTLEGRTDAVWSHDHSVSPGGFSESNFMGTLSSGNFITCGAPNSTFAGYVTYGASSYNGTLTIKRVD